MLFPAPAWEWNIFIWRDISLTAVADLPSRNAGIALKRSNVGSGEKKFPFSAGQKVLTKVVKWNSLIIWCAGVVCGANSGEKTKNFWGFCIVRWLAGRQSPFDISLPSFCSFLCRVPTALAASISSLLVHRPLLLFVPTYQIFPLLSFPSFLSLFSFSFLLLILVLSEFLLLWIHQPPPNYHTSLSPPPSPVTTTLLAWAAMNNGMSKLLKKIQRNKTFQKVISIWI